MRSALLLATTLLLMPGTALADRREVYVLASGAPTYVAADDPAGGTVRSSKVGVGAELASCYGLTNTIHIGATARFNLTRDLAFANLAVGQKDGSKPVGTLYEDAMGIGAAALALYRLDTGYPLAPTARLELGATYLRYSRLQLVPNGTDFGFTYPDQSEWTPSASAVLAVEYRFGDWMLASVGISARTNLNSLVPWQFDVPISLGIIL